MKKPFLVVLGAVALTGAYVAGTRVQGSRADRELPVPAPQATSQPSPARREDAALLPQPATDLRSQVAGTAADDERLREVTERLGRLEAEVASLREKFDGRPRPETLSTPEAIAKELRGLAGMQDQRSQRIALLERFLELFPDHPDAKQRLDELLGELLSSDRPAALDALDRFGARVVTEGGELDSMRANVLVQNRRYDEGRSSYERALRAAGDTHGAAGASFWIAHSYKQEGRLDEAQAHFESLIARYGADPSAELASLIAGAKKQLEEIAQWKAKK